MNIEEQRISDALYLLSRDNYWDSLKIVYDILINEVFLFAKNKQKYKQHLIEEKNKEIICLLYDFLKGKNVKNIEPVISEIRLLTIFFNNFSRETLKGNINNYKLKVLALNLIGLLKFLEKNSDGAAYFFGQINSDLINEIQNNITEEIYESTNYYFEIWTDVKSNFNRDFWQDLEAFNSQELPTVFNDEELQLLTEYKEIIDVCQFNLNPDKRNRVTAIWKSDLNFDEIKEKAFSQYYLIETYQLMEAFRKADKSSGKYSKNIYIKELEEGFHKNIYPFITENKKYDLVLSEHNSGRQRHDIVLFDSDTNFSAIIELKVNKLKNIQDNVQQLIEYLNEASDKPYAYMSEPNIGVLAIYSIGDEPLSEIDLVDELTGYPTLTKYTNNFYTFTSEEVSNKPILIALFNGKE